MRKNNETFSCMFKGAAVSVTVDIEAVKTGRHAMSLEWQGKPSMRIFPDYVKWMHTVLSHVSKLACKQILHVYIPGAGEDGVAYLYEEDGTYKKVQ